MIQPNGADKEVSAAFVVAGGFTSVVVRQCVWRPEAAAQEFGAAGGAGVDRLRRSLQLFSARTYGSEVKLHSQCAAGSHQAREFGNRNVQDGPLCR